MAESQEDQDVDALITDLQSTLNKLKAAQSKDVKDEDSEEQGESEPKPNENFRGKNLREANAEAYVRVRAHRRSVGKPGSDESGKPDKQDRLK